MKINHNNHTIFFILFIKRLQRFRLIAVLILIFSQSGCLSKEMIQQVGQNQQYYNKKAEEYYTNGNYLKLKIITDIRLKENPNDYIAAYYNAYSLQKLLPSSGLKFYLEFLENHPDIPEDYEIKWLDLALMISEKKINQTAKSSLKLYQDKFHIIPDKQMVSAPVQPRIQKDHFYYYYLDKQGNLYQVKILNKKVKKLNYHKTRDFFLTEKYLFYNDSVNLIKYDFTLNKYFIVHSFEEDKITLLNIHPPSKSLTVRYTENKQSLVMLINYETGGIKHLPNNYLTLSDDYLYLVIGDHHNAEIFDLEGKSHLKLKGDFIGFGKNSSIFYYYLDHYIYQFELIKKADTRLIYFPEYKKVNAFTAIKENIIFFSFDQYMLILKSKNEVENLIRGELIQSFNSGFIYRNLNHLYFYSYFDNRSHLLSFNADRLNQLVFSDNESSLILLKEDTTCLVSNLSDYFPTY